MSLSHTPSNEVMQAWLQACSAGVDVDVRFLEAHLLVAGNPLDLVDGLIFAQENGLRLSPTNAAARQLVAQYAEDRPLRDCLSELMEAGYRNIDAAPVRPNLLASPE